MPLVPDHLIHAWYSKSSWVYRNFAFIFDNPVWHKPVPNGFSVCPFFQLALFSLFILRPFIYALVGIQLLARSCRVTGALRWTDGVVLRAIGSRESPLGMATVLGLILCIAPITVILGFWTWASSCWEVGAFGAFVLPVLNVAVLIPCMIYANNHRYSSDRCEVEVYVRSLAFLSVTAAFLWHPELATFAFIELPIDFVAEFCDFFITGMVMLWGLIVACLSLVWAAKVVAVWSIIATAVAAAIGWVAVNYGPSLCDGAKATVKLRRHPLYKSRLAELLWDLYNADFDERHESRPLSWWDRFLCDHEDLLDPYLNAETWDVGSVFHAVHSILQPAAVAATLAELDARRRRREACQKVTAAIARLFRPVTAVWEQVRIGLSYLKALLKAKKEGICPYLTFHD